MRFRKYLGKQYSRPDLQTKYLSKLRTTIAEGIPILPIYILGDKLTKEKIPVLRVQRQYMDVATQEIIKHKNKFVEALTHDGIFIQVPHLTGNMRTELEQLLLIFDQSNIEEPINDDEMKEHILAIDESNYPDKFKRLIRRLKQAMSEPKIVEQMEAEDGFLSVLASLQSDVNRERKGKLEAKKREEEAKKREEEERRQKEKAIRKLHLEKNMDIATLASLFNKSEADIQAILEK